MRRALAIGLVVAAAGCAGPSATAPSPFGSAGDVESILRELEATGDVDGPDAPADRDHDGVPDRYDSCRGEPELEVGHLGDGCPDADYDSDGIADRRDPCPVTPGLVCRTPGSAAVSLEPRPPIIPQVDGEPAPEPPPRDRQKPGDDPSPGA